MPNMQMFSSKEPDLTEALDSGEPNAVLEWLVKYNTNTRGVKVDVPQWKSDYVHRIFVGGYKRLFEYQPGLLIESRSGGQYHLSVKAGMIETSNFQPSLTPDQILRVGAFGGKYLNALHREVPVEWVLLALAEDKIRPYSAVPDPTVNYYGVLSGQSLSEWRAKGWIRDQDPLGWFQWYLRYYLGRRSADDARQIGRWRAFKRHYAQVIAHPDQPRLIQKQALLQWAYALM
jgi:hypothetical protein